MINEKASKPRKPHAEAFRPNKPKDDQLWSPLEFLLFSVAIVSVFAFTMGQANYAYVAYLFEPVFLIGVIGLLAQWAFKAWRNKPSEQDNL